MFEDEGRCTDRFAAGRESLDESAQHQKCWSQSSNLREGRQQSDSECCQSDSHQGDEQDLTATEFVSQHAEEHSAKRPDEEGDTERRERREQACQRAV
ncbi:hypothetical protein D3C74_436640 [compost metagenome]